MQDQNKVKNLKVNKKILNNLGNRLNKYKKSLNQKLYYNKKR